MSVRQRITTYRRVRRPCVAPRLVYVLWVALLLVLRVQGESETDEKDEIQKGDDECPSFAQRLNDYTEDGDDKKWLTPCVESNAPPSVETPVNGVDLLFYSTLPAYADHFGTFLSWIVVAYLNEASINYNVKLSVPIALFNATNDYRPPNGYLADIVHEHVDPKNIEKKDANWWWEYRLIFHCYHGQGIAVANPALVGTPITDPMELKEIKQELNLLLRQGMEILSTFDLLQSSHEIVGFAVGNPQDSNTPFIDGPPTPPPTLAPSVKINLTVPTLSPTTLADKGAPSNVDDENMDDYVEGGGPFDAKDVRLRPTFGQPLDVQQWDWRRYIGLVMFVFTFVGTAFLTVVSAVRHHRRAVKDLWGNLGSEEGVDALLNTGWKVKGCKMEVYDKQGWGYKDDDSIFLGGYEQRHVGAEITVTHEDDSRTMTTPDSQPQW